MNLINVNYKNEFKALKLKLFFRKLQYGLMRFEPVAAFTNFY